MNRLSRVLMWLACASVLVLAPSPARALVLITYGGDTTDGFSPGMVVTTAGGVSFLGSCPSGCPPGLRGFPSGQEVTFTFALPQWALQPCFVPHTHLYIQGADIVTDGSVNPGTFTLVDASVPGSPHPVPLIDRGSIGGLDDSTSVLKEYSVPSPFNGDRT